MKITVRKDKSDTQAMKVYVDGSPLFTVRYEHGYSRQHFRYGAERSIRFFINNEKNFYTDLPSPRTYEAKGMSVQIKKILTETKIGAKMIKQAIRAKITR